MSEENNDKKEEKKVPSAIDAFDMLTLENANLRREVLELRLAIAKRDIELRSREIRDRYALAEGDAIDPNTFAIIRKG